jgi:hypothetical protein
LFGLKLKGSDEHKAMVALPSGMFVDVAELAASVGLDLKPTVNGDNISFSTLLIPGTTPKGIASVVEIEGELVVVIFGGEVHGEASATYFVVKKTKEDDEKINGCNAVYGLFIASALLPFVVKRKNK